MAFVLHTDGGSRGNPGPAACGFSLDDSGEVIFAGGWYLGEVTNNHAEYCALIWGLENALAHGIKSIQVRADSELMVKQMLGQYKVKNADMKILNKRAAALAGRFDEFEIAHVYRESNKEADLKANEAMDAAAPVGSYLVDFVDGEVGLSATPSMFETVTTEQSAPAQEEQTSEKRECGMYELTVKDHFDAAHALEGYPGQCANLHGHTWDIEVTVGGTELDSIGILYDFKALKTDLHGVLDAFDHHYLNEVEPFTSMNSTAENMARVIWDRIEATLPAQVHLVEVVVWESPVAKLAYRK